MKRLKVRLLSPPEDVSWGMKYIATALGRKGYQIIEPHTGEIIKDVGDVHAYSVAWGDKYLAIGSSKSVIFLDRYLKERKRVEVPMDVKALKWEKGELLCAAGNEWLVKLDDEDVVRRSQIGLTATTLLVRGNKCYVGTKEGMVIVVDSETLEKIDSFDVGSSVVGMGWISGGLLVATTMGHLLLVDPNDPFRNKIIKKFDGISAFAMNPKNDEFVVAEKATRSLVFMDQYFNVLKKTSMNEVIMAMAYSSTSIEVAVVLENGELITLATPKIEDLVNELLRESMCEAAGEVVCLALERALWKFIGSLAPDVNIDEFHALKQLGPSLVEMIACLEKHIDELRRVIKNIVSLEDVVEVLKDGCERLEKWLDTVAKNAECIMKLSEKIETLLDIASSDILPTQLPTSISLVEQFGCEKANKLVDCILDTYKILRDINSITEELGVVLPPPGEIILYMVIKGECDEMKNLILRLSELRVKAATMANEGKINEVLKIRQEAAEIADKIKNMVESTLPEGYVGP